MRRQQEELSRWQQEALRRRPEQEGQR
jgi:hypothetical protein